MAIPPGSLQRLYDISDPACYPGTGNTVYNTAQATYNLTAYNSPTFVSDGQASYFQFNGSSNYLGIPGDVAMGSIGSTFTLNAWFQSSDLANFGTVCSFGKNDPSGIQPTIFANHGPSGNLPGIDSASFNYGVGLTFTTTAVPVDTWQMVTMVADGTNTKIYLNGTLEGTVAQGGGTWPTSGGSFIGVLGNSVGNPAYNYFNGKVGYLAQYDVALGASDVLQIYNDTKNRFLGLIAQYDVSNSASYPGTGNTWFDLTANNNDLTLSNQTFTSSPIKSFSFTNGYAYKASPASFPTNIFTIDAWIKFSGSGSQIIYALGKDGSGTVPLLGYKFPSENSGKPFFEMGGGVARLNLTLDPIPNVWYNYVITADGSTIKSYVDGVLDISVAQSGSAIASTNPGLILGQFLNGSGAPSGTFYSNASYGQFNIYSSALDATEILDNYNATKNTYVIPIAQYDFSNTSTWTGSGTTAYDLSPYGNDLVLANSPTLTGTGTSKTLSVTSALQQSARKSTPLNGITDVPLTFNIWSKLNGNTTYQALMSYGIIGDATIPGIWGSFANLGEIAFEGGFGNPTIQSGITPNNTDFYNIIASISPSTVTLYVNGASVGSTSHTISVSGSPQFSLSGLFDPTNLYTLNAEIGLAEVYNVALGSTQVTNLYNSQVSRFSPTPPPSSNGVGGRSFGQGFNG